jgi:hypothetical protein
MQGMISAIHQHLAFSTLNVDVFIANFIFN